MPRYARKTKTITRHKRVGRYNRRTNRYSRKNYRVLSRRISAVSRRVAGEVCKFESTPALFSTSHVVVGTSSQIERPLQTITSGVPFVYPLNWFYTNAEVTGTYTPIYANGSQLVTGQDVRISLKNPIWYNTQQALADTTFDDTDFDSFNDVSPGLQYRLKYIYINALFNASISQSVNNTDGALRIVIVKDKQPTGGSATWADENKTTNSRGVFNANRIDAQLNPNTVGRFRIMYDKTLRFNNTNGYKPFKYFKRLGSTVRNNRDIIPAHYYRGSTNIQNNNPNSSTNYLETSERSPPVQKNAFYLMIFSDGLTFTYSSSAETPAAGFHLFNRIAYYNN